MKCKNKNCNKEHDGNFGSGKYCSRSCANSRTHSDKTKNKISSGVKNHIKRGGNIGGVKNMSLEEFDLMNKRKIETWNKKTLEQEFSLLTGISIKKRILLEQNNKCNHCGIDKWNGENLILELEHKNGNHDDDSRENLECICPNCHSLTPTWRGRNKKKRKKISDNEICRTFLTKGNIRQTLLELGLAAKGSNYGRVKRCLTINNIKYK